MKDKPRIYIAGKVTGLPMDQVWHRFMTKEVELMGRGYEVLNPVRMVAEELKGSEDTWANIMRYCIQVMMSANEIYLLTDWKDSEGARIEHRLASELGFNMIYESPDVQMNDEIILKAF